MEQTTTQEALVNKLHELGFRRDEDWFLWGPPDDDDFECIHIDTIAALSTPASVEPVAESSAELHCTAGQLREALNFLDAGDEDSHETEIVLSHFPSARVSTDGDPLPAGLYAWLAEYPEEGCIGPLESVAAPSPPAPAGGEVADEAVSKLIEALELYADPGFYHACLFMFDRPTGGFDEDFSFDEGYGRAMPGKFARETLEFLAAHPPQAQSTPICAGDPGECAYNGACMYACGGSPPKAAATSQRCDGCDLPNGCPEYCRCTSPAQPKVYNTALEGLQQPAPAQPAPEPQAQASGDLAKTITRLMHIASESGVAEGRHGDEWRALVERARAHLAEQAVAHQPAPQAPTKVDAKEQLLLLARYFRRIECLWEGPDGAPTNGTIKCLGIAGTLEDLSRMPMALGLTKLPALTTIPEAKEKPCDRSGG